MMNAKSIRRLLAAAALALCAPASWPQASTTRADGRITDAGKSLSGVQVILSNQDTFQAYRATTDKYGTFSIPEVARGTYIVSILNAGGDKLFRKTLPLTSAPDAPIRLDIDISGAAAGSASGAGAAASSSPSPGGASRPPAGAGAAEYAKNPELDALVHRYESALRAGDQPAEISALKAIVAADPTRWDYFEALGDAQMSSGDYEHAAESYEKGIQAVQRFLSSNPANGSVIVKSDRDRAQAGMVQMLIHQGNAYLKLKKNSEAIAASAKAAELAADTDTAYYNLCVMYYNTRTLDGAVDACNKAIAANPNRADAYFIEGALLFSATKTGKDGSRIVAPGAVEALRKYLQLAPAGAYAKEARQMLEYLGVGAGTSGGDVKRP
ncbi:MAG TPA: carboxypeptidase regulatory-like domain-containing protein [Candidatus Acidoferrales bacterium]|nr:carboxypeptidase regulatory-like domain-containing protein [Candidatus Acidoferrales bacterium]